MPRERKDSRSSNDESDGGSSSDESSGSGSDSSSSGNSSGHDSKRSSARRSDRNGPSNDTRTTPSKKRREDNSRDSSGDEATGKSRDRGNARRSEKESRGTPRQLDSESGELSSSDGEHVHRSGPRSTVVQKVTKENNSRTDVGNLGRKASSRESDVRDKDKRDDKDESYRRKRSHSHSPRNRDEKRFREDGTRDRRASDRQQRRDDRKDDRGRQRDREADRPARNSDRRRDDDRRRDGDRSRRDQDRDRPDRRRDADGDRRDDRRRDRDGDRRGHDNGDRRRDKEDKASARRDDDKENKADDGVSRKRKAEEENSKEMKESGEAEEKKPKDPGAELLTTRTGGAYIPPAKLRMMQAQITDKSSVAYQRMAWEALKKSINGLINKVNVSNLIDIVRELFQENIVRGRGLLARSVIQAQAASPTFTHVYAALVAIINTKFPQNGELILQRLILQFKRGYRRNDKNLCLSSTRFIAHLVNQQVAHEVIALEILTLLLENATEDSVEVSISFLKEVGQKLTDVSPKGINAIFERLRSVLHEGQLDKRVQYMVEVMFAIRKDGFKDHPAVIPDLDLVEEDDQFTHLLTLEEVTSAQDQLNVFKADPEYLENEEKYKTLKKEILAEGSSDEEGSGDESGDDSSSDEDDSGDEEETKQDIVDNTETNMVALRRTIYLTIQSSLDFEECAHKLLKMEFKPGQEVELCYMILDCCAQLRTYEKFFGLLAQRFCQLERKYVEPFQNIFREQFETIHRLDTNKLRNVAKFFAHLLHTDAISWGVMNCIKLTETDTTSASRIFIKILFLELSEYMGLPKLNNRLRDPTLQEYFEGIMPRNNPKDTRFVINFFTTIGLGGLTEDLREHLKGLSKQLMQQKQQQQQQEQLQDASSSSDSSDSDSSDSDSSDSSESDSDSSSSGSDSSDSSSQSDTNSRKKRRQSSSKAKDKKDDKHSKSRDKVDSRRGSRDQRKAIEASMNGGGREERRPRIEDKLLKLSMGDGVAPVSFGSGSSLRTEEPPSGRQKRRERGGRNRSGKSNRLNLRTRRLSSNNAEGRGRTRQNSDRDPRNSSFDHQGSDRAEWQSERDYYRGDRSEGGRARPQSPEMDGQRDGWRDEDSARGRRGNSGRRDTDRSPRGGARYDGLTDRQAYRDGDRSPVREDRRNMESPPPQRRDRMGTPPRRQDMDYQSRHANSPPRRPDRRDLGSPPRSNRMDSPSPPRSRGHREMESPPPRSSHRNMDPSPQHVDSRRDMESPSWRGDNHDVDSPPRRQNRWEVDRSPPVKDRRDAVYGETQNGNKRRGEDRYSDRRGVDVSPPRNSLREKKGSRENDSHSRRRSLTPERDSKKRGSRGEREPSRERVRDKDRRRR